MKKIILFTMILSAQANNINIAPGLTLNSNGEFCMYGVLQDRASLDVLLGVDSKGLTPDQLEKVKAVLMRRSSKDEAVVADVLARLSGKIGKSIADDIKGAVNGTLKECIDNDEKREKWLAELQYLRFDEEQFNNMQAWNKYCVLMVNMTCVVFGYALLIRQIQSAGDFKAFIETLNKCAVAYKAFDIDKEKKELALDLLKECVKIRWFISARTDVDKTDYLHRFVDAVEKGGKTFGLEVPKNNELLSSFAPRVSVLS